MMKRLFALLLAVLMVVGLVACGGKPDPTDPTDPADPTGTTPGTPVDPSDPGSENRFVFSDKFKGTTLQIWGFTKENYTDHDNMGKGNYIWMMVAAIEEWAAASGVTIEWKGSYNQSQVLADINSGGKPDIIFYDNSFPTVANMDLATPLTDEEYNALAEACGDARYLDMLKTKGASYGFVYPWSGNMMCYYNKTMFERYDVKTPKEYYMEGNWNWTTLQETMKQMTRDLDGDGTTDTYGLPGDSLPQLIKDLSSIDKETGKLMNHFEEQVIRDWLEFVYENVTIQGTVKRPGPHNIQKNVTYPMYAMQMSDCEPYNFEHLYQSIPNGDILEVVPIPVYDGEGDASYYLRWTQSAASLCRSCDNREAAVNMLTYLIQCGRKYIEDFSLGAVACDFAGIQGTCEISKGWKEAFAEVCAIRAEDIQEWDYDEELIAKYYETFASADGWSATSGLTFSYSEIYTMPPASSIPAVKDKWQAKIDEYNKLYS